MATGLIKSFRTVIMVDWSAASSRGPARPSPDRCWIGHATDGTLAPPEYCRTRHEAEARLRALLGAVPGPVLLGFDFPFGYPAGSGMGGGRALAARLAGLIEDRPDGGNNRFAVAARLNAELNAGEPGPFWGCPPAAAGPQLTMLKFARRGRAFADRRLVDARLASRNIQPCWKLYTTGSVGSQILMGLPAVHRLLADPVLGPRCRLWPFETGWSEGLAPITIAEIWPSLFPHAAEDHAIRDARQVLAVCRWAMAADAAAALARPLDLTPEQEAVCLAEEGWILGVGTGVA